MMIKSNRFAPKNKYECFKEVAFLIQKYAIVNDTYADWLYNNKSQEKINNNSYSDKTYIHYFLLYLCNNSIEPKDIDNIIDNIAHFFINGEYKITLDNVRKIIALDLISGG